MKNLLLLTILLLTLDTFGISQKDTMNAFEVSISAAKNLLEQGEELVIVMVVKNTSDSSAQFCRYHTPFEGITNEIFEVTKEGEALPYHGVLASRLPPTAKDYITLSPGQSTSCEVSLNKAYSIEAQGNYTVRFRGSAISQLDDSNQIAFEIR